MLRIYKVLKYYQKSTKNQIARLILKKKKCMEVASNFLVLHAFIHNQISQKHRIWFSVVLILLKMQPKYYHRNAQFRKQMQNPISI